MEAVVLEPDEAGCGADVFAVVFRDLHRDAVRLAWLLCGDADRAEDAVSEAFARVYVHWREGRVADLRPYLRRAVVNQIRNVGRRRVLELREAGRHSGDQRGPRLHDDDVAERDEVRRLLSQLTSRQRQVIVLRFYADLDTLQTADVLGCPVGTVKSLTSRGLARLRALQDAQAAA
ncbi:MAG: sigma-70 family RNA polymerase sigma factor [Egibacteraceae bacterium]